jgi:hypothetical protein
MTNFSNICDILGEVFSEHAEQENLKDFIYVHNLSFPLAFMYTENLATPSATGIKYIMSTWKLFLELVGVEDTGFTDLDSVLNI